METKRNETWESKAADSIWDDLSDRGGWTWDDLDDYTRTEIIESMERIIRSHHKAAMKAIRDDAAPSQPRSPEGV